jgi:type IV pilus assembly protein PilB
MNEKNLNEWLHETDTVQQVNQLLSEAISQNASDIHIEPQEKSYQIRFRKDGLLNYLTHLDTGLAERLNARVKVLGHLDVAEKRLPQDGHFSFNTPLKKAIDIRLSTCPTIYGEKLVLRILNPTAFLKNLEDLGFEDEQKKLFTTALKKPQGLVLFIGPTGSGKTVSMYAALQTLDPAKKNILTIEDPVEINISGLNQVNINQKAGLTFASSLRTFLRQDPDVIMVGEIRDTETAQIVIKASQTGHLILSTIHAQNTIQALERLLNLELTAAQIQSNLLLLVAQRLVRKLCENCKKPVKYTKEMLNVSNILSTGTLFEPTGCRYCQFGYSGRVGIFELLPVTPKFIAGFYQKNFRELLETLLNKEGISLRMAGMRKIMQGTTSLEEVDRVIPKEFLSFTS